MNKISKIIMVATDYDRSKLEVGYNYGNDETCVQATAHTMVKYRGFPFYLTVTEQFYEGSRKSMMFLSEEKTVELIEKLQESLEKIRSYKNNIE